MMVELGGTQYIADEEIGYRPILDGHHFTAMGIRTDYSSSTSAKGPRILFIGDSVTARGKIVQALKARMDGTTQLLNSGVEGYDTAQAVAFYQRYNHLSDPDSVVLTFSPNDFEVTPIVFRDANGELALHSSLGASNSVHSWFLINSSVYRLLSSLLYFRGFDFTIGVNRSRGALSKLAAQLASKRQRFLVLALPPLRHTRADWSSRDLRAWSELQKLSNELDLDTLELTTPVNEAAVSGDIQEYPDDPYHPNDHVAGRIAEFVLAQRSEVLVYRRPPID
jgi:hypothetical protein